MFKFKTLQKINLVQAAPSLISGKSQTLLDCILSIPWSVRRMGGAMLGECFLWLGYLLTFEQLRDVFLLPVERSCTTYLQNGSIWKTALKRLNGRGKNKRRKWNLLPWKCTFRSTIHELFQCWRSSQLVSLELDGATSAEMPQHFHGGGKNWCIISKNLSLPSGISLGIVTCDCYQETGSNPNI